jgi:pimeloyl-[acyl-carrier protein] methyl ester esterase
VTAAANAGRALVLIHGWGFSRAVWSPVLAALDGLPALAPELPGHGDWSDGDRLADVHEAARALLEQIPAWVREPVWAGWSLGGLAALAAAQQWQGPQRLALICATPRFTVGPDWTCALKPPLLAAFADELGRDRQALERRFAALCTQGANAPAPLRRRLLALMADRPATEAGLKAGLAALANADLRPVWARLDAPCWAWLAENDRLVPGAVVTASGPGAKVGARAPEPAPNGSRRDGSMPGSPPEVGRHEPHGVAARLAALRPDARLRVVPGGHASWLEDPEGLAGFLREVMA